MALCTSTGEYVKCISHIANGVRVICGRSVGVVTGAFLEIWSFIMEINENQRALVKQFIYQTYWRGFEQSKITITDVNEAADDFLEKFQKLETFDLDSSKFFMRIYNK